MYRLNGTLEILQVRRVSSKAFVQPDAHPGSAGNGARSQVQLCGGGVAVARGDEHGRGCAQRVDIQCIAHARPSTSGCAARPSLHERLRGRRLHELHSASARVPSSSLSRRPHLH